MAGITHVWHAGPITEVQANQAQQYVTPVYVTFSLSAALAVAGGIVLGLELANPPPADKPSERTEEKPRE
jgi:hypothetical protein